MSASALSNTPTVSAGFDAADGDDLGECHVTPVGYAHMTNMLCSLANGRVVVVLEVFGIYFFLLVFPRDRRIGGLQPRINLKFGIGGREGPTGRPTPSTTPALSKRGGLENCLGGLYGAESILEVYEPKSACSQER